MSQPNESSAHVAGLGKGVGRVEEEILRFAFTAAGKPSVVAASSLRSKGFRHSASTPWRRYSGRRSARDVLTS